LQPGIAYTSRTVLQIAIVLLGFEMNLYNVLHVGATTALLMVFTLSAAFLTAWIAGKALHVAENSATLVGVGTAICGGSAIAATAPVIGASDEEVAGSISTIFLFNVVAAFLFPALGHLLHMSDDGFGLWAGTAINDTSSVVAAGYAFSNTAGNLAVIVKLTRTLMILPVTLVLAFVTARRGAKEGAGKVNLWKIMPWFVLGFLAASVLRTFLPPGAVLPAVLVQIGKYLIVMAMVCIGLNTNLPILLRNGLRPLMLGLACWIVLAIVSLAAQHLLGLAA
jgi:uncharacterized integral membrane protein (TIGR00698 family)